MKTDGYRLESYHSSGNILDVLARDRIGLQKKIFIFTVGVNCREVDAPVLRLHILTENSHVLSEWSHRKEAQLFSSENILLSDDHLYLIIYLDTWLICYYYANIKLNDSKISPMIRK